jgi:hypothetical protein
LRRLGFYHDGFESYGTALIEVAEQGGEINGGFPKSVCRVIRYAERAVRNCNRVGIQRSEHSIGGHGSRRIKVGEAAAGAVGQPTPDEEVNSIAPARECQAQEYVVGGSPAVRSRGDKIPVIASNQRALEKFEVYVRIAAGACAIGSNNRPGMAVSVSAEVHEDVVYVRFA